jgi:6-phosphogluconolactonase
LKGSQLIIEKILKSLTPELTVLGLGADGHKASLFPGHSRIFYENDAILINTNNDWEEFDRISLTFNYLMKTDKIVFLVNGKEKARALKECLDGNFNPVEYPSQFIFQNYLNDIHVVCDQSSAKNLA